MLSFLRSPFAALLTPFARWLLRLGVTPTAVTVTGTIGVVLAAVWFLPRGEFLAGAGVVALMLLADGLDGTMARQRGGESALGGFLDSTLDRIADGAVFGALAVWAAGQSRGAMAVALAALVLGHVVSYSRARAEVEGWDASVGVMERADRLVVALAAALAVGLGAPPVVLVVALAVVALGSAVTVVQRISAAVRGARLDGSDAPHGSAQAGEGRDPESG